MDNFREYTTVGATRIAAAFSALSGLPARVNTRAKTGANLPKLAFLQRSYKFFLS
jgi:hypothetical protein